MALCLLHGTRVPSCVSPVVSDSHHKALMRCWVRAIPPFRVSMPLNPNATPFVRASSSAAASAADAASAARGENKAGAPPKIYCDLDGCLADFDKGCQSVMGETPDKLSRKVMWRGLAQAKGFCEFQICCGTGIPPSSVFPSIKHELPRADVPAL